MTTKSTTRRGARAAVAIAATALLSAACSQTAALAPVGGNRLAEVRFAANDVLLDQRIELLSAPVCTASGADDAQITCTGTTTDGQPITVLSTAKDQTNFTITIGTRTVFRGSVESVLDAHARPSS